MAFGGDDRVSNDLCQQRGRFKRPGIDLLFVGTDPNTAASPWEQDDGYWKILELGSKAWGISWRPISDSEAQYIETKDGNSDEPSSCDGCDRLLLPEEPP